jgi:signal transduction histidine kinase
LAAITVTLLILLPGLAFLQYQWVGQVADAERVLMERSLRTAARQLRDAFDGEVARAATALRVGSVSMNESAWSSYAARYAAWASTARHPGLLRNVFLVDENTGGLQLRRWNQTARAFEPVAWSHSFQAWRPRFQRAIQAWRASGRTPDHVILADDPSLLIMPIVGTAGGQTRSPRTRPDMLGFSVVEVDWEFLRTRLLPELVDRFTSDDVTYLASVDDGAQPPAVLYASQPGVSVDARGFEMQLLHPELRDPLALYPPLMLRVQYRSGPIAAAVDDIRRHNLAISGGILLLLTFSVGLLALTSRRAQRLARQQMEFVAGVSHELRTPVAVIQSAAENLSHGVVDSGDRVRQYGTTVAKEARRLGEMIERVLQYAGMASQRGLSSNVSVAPAEIVDSAVEAAGPWLAGAHVERTLAPNLPSVLGDPTALSSALHNLITNAVKYGGPTGWVGIRAELVSESGRRDEIQIAVEDRGAGIAKADLPHVFEPFYRGTNAIGQQVRGSGVGLSIVRSIAVAHGGRVTVSTRPGIGSVFTIHLPAAEHARDSLTTTTSTPRIARDTCQP